MGVVGHWVKIVWKIAVSACLVHVGRSSCGDEEEEDEDDEDDEDDEERRRRRRSLLVIEGDPLNSQHAQHQEEK